MLENTEKNLMLGIGGLLTLLVIAFLVPSVTESFSFANISLSEMIVLIGAILSIIGLFGFSPKSFDSYKDMKINVLRLIYAVLFIWASYLF